MKQTEQENASKVLENRIFDAFAQAEQKLHDNNNGVNSFKEIETIEDEEHNEENEIVEITEDEMLSLLDQENDPFELCKNIFKHPPPYSSEELKTITSNQVQHLYEHGFVIIDDFEHKSICHQVHEQTCDLAAQGKLKKPQDNRISAPNKKSEEFKITHEQHNNLNLEETEIKNQNEMESDPFRDNAARSDITTWLHYDDYLSEESPKNSLGQLMKIVQRLEKDLRKVIKLRRSIGEYQLALYAGNGTFYQKHRDAFPCIIDDNDDNNNNNNNLNNNYDNNSSSSSSSSSSIENIQRRLTCIFYMNESWQESDGGALELYLGKKDNGEIKTVAPLGGRLLIFLSGAIDHEVLPSYRNRVALTSWLS